MRGEVKLLKAMLPVGTQLLICDAIEHESGLLVAAPLSGVCLTTGQIRTSPDQQPSTIITLDRHHHPMHSPIALHRPTHAWRMFQNPSDVATISG